MRKNDNDRDDRFEESRDGNLRWTANKGEKCACDTRGYGYGGKCLYHAEQERRGGRR